MTIDILEHDVQPDIKIITPGKIADERGFFSEVYRSDLSERLRLEHPFTQENHVYSKTKGVLRGLHYQSNPFAQDKLLRVIRGKIWDVVVDIRHGSASYGQWLGIELSAKNWKQLFVPRGFAHGYVTLEDHTELVYKVNNSYSVEHDHGIAWDDPDLAIDWKLPLGIEPILSDKDAQHHCLREMQKHFIKN